MTTDIKAAAERLRRYRDGEPAHEVYDGVPGYVDSDRLTLADFALGFLDETALDAEACKALGGASDNDLQWRWRLPEFRGWSMVLDVHLYHGGNIGVFLDQLNCGDDDDDDCVTLPIKTRGQLRLLLAALEAAP